LSCVEALSRELPDESIIYFGDTARTPYGDKAPETIRYFTCQIADFLATHDVKMMVIACNTISALCVDMLRGRFPTIPIVDIITPTRDYIASWGQRTEPIGIIATKATVKSNVYEKLLREKGVETEVYSKACPLFVPLIENGFKNGVVVDTIVQHYLEDFIRPNKIGKLVLGCTHYPFIENSIRRLYPWVEIINPSNIITRRVKDILEEQGLRAERGTEAVRLFYASDLSESFVEMSRHASPTEDYSVRFQAFKEIYKTD